MTVKITVAVLLMGLGLLVFVQHLVPQINDMLCNGAGTGCTVAHPDTEPIPRLIPLTYGFILVSFGFLAFAQHGNLLTLPFLLLVWAFTPMLGNSTFPPVLIEAWLLMGGLGVAIVASIPSRFVSSGARGLASLSHMLAITFWFFWTPDIPLPSADYEVFHNYIIWLALPASLMMSPVAWGIWNHRERIGGFVRGRRRQTAPARR